MTQREKLARAKMSLLGNWPTKSNWLTKIIYRNQPGGYCQSKSDLGQFIQFYAMKRRGQMPTPDPIWTNWEFWSVVVAFGALLKSEFPPVHSLFKRPRLELEVHNRIIITHGAGNPNVNLFLSLSNVGNCDIRIRSITLLISPGDREPFELPVQTFFPILTENKPVIFSQFKLPPRRT